MSQRDPQTTADIAWIRLVHAARDWANHMDQWERFKFTTEHGLVYVSVDRSVPYPDRFDVVDSLTGHVLQAMADQVSETESTLKAAGIRTLSPWEFLQTAGVVVDLAWAELLFAKTGCSVRFWLNMQEAYENER